MFVVRPALIQDVEPLQDLYRNHLVTSPPAMSQSLEGWREVLTGILRDPLYHLLVGEWDGVVVASVTIVAIKNLTHGLRPYALIENVVTHAGYRNRGFAKTLMQRAIGIAIGHGCYKVMLLTGSKEESTLRFYRSCGFNSEDKTAFIRWLP